jgi:hypothetical protein
VGRLILLIILGLCVGFYFPDSRAMILDKGEPVLRPFLEWNAMREAETIAAGVQQQETSELRLPSKGEWLKWLDSHYAGDAARDPWGNLYQYEIQPDSFAISSNGPDRVRKTADDIRDVRVRQWQAKGSGKP